MMAAHPLEYIPRGELSHNEPMSKHTSWRTGGPAEWFFRPADRDDLIRFLAALHPDTEVTWVGLGSNLLVRDGGIAGVVVVTHKCFERIELRGENRVYAESGVAGAKLARFCVRKGLSGAEFFAGIPGTFGGALTMNAGAFGSETWDVVTRVETIDRSGSIRVRTPMEFEIGYRRVIVPASDWFLSGEILLDPGSVEEGRQRVKRLLSERAKTQPIQVPNAGSVFRNPRGDYAARLIEASGLKGMSIGKAAVSSVHANFIVNEGNARAADIEHLISHIQRVVAETQGIELEREVRIIGATE